MNRRFALKGGSAILGMVLLLAALIGVSTQETVAQNRPELPTLSLTGSQSGWNASYYPDGRIWVPQRQTVNSERTMLVPVFIKNCWRTTSTFEAFPIYSFKFKVQFDSTALEFIGVEKNGPRRGTQNMPIGCLAEDFEFSTDVDRDTTYQTIIGADRENRRRGKRVMITGISSKSLPQTGDINSPCDQRPFVELVYLRFKVVADPVRFPVSGRTPLIITNDTLFYNDFQMGFERAFPDDPIPSIFTGLGGVDNFFINQQTLLEEIRDPLRPSKPGMLWVEVTDLIPQLSFTNVADPRFREVDSVAGSNGTEWYVVNPITIDVGSNYDDNVNGMGTRDIDVINAVTGSRATDITVQSDSRWLKFKSFLKGGNGEINPFPQPVREGYVAMLDKGILGTTLGVTPDGSNTVGMRDLNMRIICDPNELDQGSGNEIAGIHVGYLTFKSTTLAHQPVRIKVTFIYFRNPFEPNVFDEAGNWEEDPDGRRGAGILLNIRNSAQPVQSTNIVFGVGHRATNEVDTLFGETVYTTAQSGFSARWFPRNESGATIYTNGLGDLWTPTSTRARNESRDIRDIYADTTLLYYCRVKTPAAEDYPIVITWNTSEFSPASELFLRDTAGGSLFNVNMRNATNIGGSRYSYTITDADIDAFVIEYTLPKVAQFPVINKGWNLLSMPVNPASTNWKSVFKSSLNIPIRFAQNSYQTNDPDLQVGVGYFVKYSDEVDTRIAGARVTRIDEQTFPVRMYEGWNTIGSLSTPTSIENVTLVPYGSGAFPEITADIYRYVTDRGYQAVSEIQPGLGYWMKISGQAYLRMTNGRTKAGINFGAARESVRSNATVVTVADAANRTNDLYVAENGSVEVMDMFQLPPVPPSNMFDVRFSNHSYVEDAVNPMIRLQGATFPVTVTMNNAERNYTVVNAITGEVFGSVVAGTNNTIVVPNASAIRLLGEDTNLGALAVNVTPNPASAEGMVNVTVPATGRVVVELFNVVGERIATLVDESKNAGVYSFDINAAQYPAGRYIVKVTNNNNVVTGPVTIVR